MEKKDLTKENLIDFLHSEDSFIRKTAFEYCVGQILTHPAPIVSIVELLQNSNRISKEDQCKAIKNKTQSLQEYRHSRFFDLVYGSPYEVNAIANVLLTSKEIRLDKLCLRRLNNIKGSPEEENFIVFVLFCRAIENSYFEKQLGLRMKHGFNQLTDWRNLTDQMINFKDTPEIIRLKLVLADLLTHSMNIDNFKNLYCFLTKFALQTKDLAIKALKHFNQIGPWSSDNINQIVSLMNHETMGTSDFQDKVFKILLPSFAINSSATMTPVRELYADNIIAKKEFLQALDDLNAVPITRNSCYTLLYLLNQFIDEIPQDDTELCLKYCEFAIQLIHAGAAEFNRSEMQYAFLLVRKIEKISFVLACEVPEIYLNLLCSKTQNTQEQITGILAFAEDNPQYLSLTLDKIDFRLAPVDTQIIYHLRNNYGKDNNPMIKIHYLTALETIAERTNLDKNAQFALDYDVVPQLALNEAQFKTFPNLKKAYERYQAREELLNLLT